MNINIPNLKTTMNLSGFDNNWQMKLNTGKWKIINLRDGL